MGCRRPPRANGPTVEKGSFAGVRVNGEVAPILADAGLAGDQHDPALAGLGLPPAAPEQVKFLVAADERHRLRAQGLEAADDTAFPDHLPGARCLGEARERLRPEVFDLEQTTKLAPRAVGDDDPVGRGDRL
jgi:hypothetical protein